MKDPAYNPMRYAQFKKVYAKVRIQYVLHPIKLKKHLALAIVYLNAIGSRNGFENFVKGFENAHD